jgi:hypothetical protein
MPRPIVSRMPRSPHVGVGIQTAPASRVEQGGLNVLPPDQPGPDQPAQPYAVALSAVVPVPGRVSPSLAHACRTIRLADPSFPVPGTPGCPDGPGPPLPGPHAALSASGESGSNSAGTTSKRQGRWGRSSDCCPFRPRPRQLGQPVRVVDRVVNLAVRPVELSPPTSSAADATGPASACRSADRTGKRVRVRSPSPPRPAAAIRTRPGSRPPARTRPAVRSFSSSVAGLSWLVLGLHRVHVDVNPPPPKNFAVLGGWSSPRGTGLTRK